MCTIVAPRVYAGDDDDDTTNVCTVRLHPSHVQRLRCVVYTQRRSGRVTPTPPSCTLRNSNNNDDDDAQRAVAAACLVRTRRYRNMHLHACVDGTLALRHTTPTPAACAYTRTRLRVAVAAAAHRGVVDDYSSDNDDDDKTQRWPCRSRAHARLQRAIVAAATSQQQQQQQQQQVQQQHDTAQSRVLSPSEALVQRWRRYLVDGDVHVFDGDARARVRLHRLLGVGGSGRVYSGVYMTDDEHNGSSSSRATTTRPVAVKVFVRLDKSTHTPAKRTDDNDDNDDDDVAYVRECLTDVAFHVLCNQMDAYNLCHACRAYDFVVSHGVPDGLARADVRLLTRCHNNNNDDDASSDGATTTTSVALAYLVTDCMHSTLGRFVCEGEADYDASYDALVNCTLRDGELFQLLYAQLVMRALFDWRVLDLMLNDQLRGDNMGYRDVCACTANDNNNDNDTSSRVRDGLLVCYDNDDDDDEQHDDKTTLHYLHFPATYARTCADNNNSSGSNGSSVTTTTTATCAHTLLLRLLYFIDLGQGVQPAVRALTQRGLIGETVPESCVVDDGLRRYWPADELYCRYVDVDSSSTLCTRVVAWATRQRIRTRTDAARALRELFALYAPHYGVDGGARVTRQQQQQQTTATGSDSNNSGGNGAARVLTWTRAARRALALHYVYRDMGDAVAV